MDETEEQIRVSVNRSVLRNRAELEFNSLRRDNRFKTHKNGKKLFMDWRLGIIDDASAAQGIGNTEVAVRMVRSRLTNSKKNTAKIDKTSKQFIRAVQQRHLEQAQEIADKVRDTDEEFKVEVLSELEIDLDKKQSKNIFVKGNIYDLLSVDPDTDLITVALMTHKRIAFDMFTMFNRATIKALAQQDRRALEWYRAASELGKTARPFLLDIVDKYGILEAGAVADVARENEEKLKVIVDYIIAKYPQDMLELMTLFNEVGGDTTQEISNDRRLQGSNGG